MKKFLVLLFGLFIAVSNCFAASLTGNASPVTVTVSQSERYKNISFTTTTRNLDITNNDALDGVFVDLKSDTNTTNISSCILLAPGDSLNLYDFMTNGITIILDNTYIGGNGVASPITVLATY